MAITQTISNLPQAPQSTDTTNFRARADAFVSALNTFEDQLNLAIPQINDLETNVNNKEASATASALVCTSAANFQGVWTNQTTSPGQSWAYNGTIYFVLIAGNTSPITTPGNWMSTSKDAQTHSAPSKGTPVDADEIPIMDSASEFILKKLTWGNLKATLLTYFNGIYANLVSPQFTGIPTAPTAVVGTNTEQLATTAFVQANKQASTGTNRLTLMTAASPRNITSVDFTGIPNWARRITVMFYGISTDGSSNLLIQIGAGGVTTGGYASGAQNSGAGTTSNTGFLITGSNASSYGNYGNVIINYFNTSTNVIASYDYVSSGNIESFGSSNCNSSGGAITLSGIVDRVRITTVNGGDKFDGGSINITYEG